MKKLVAIIFVIFSSPESGFDRFNVFSRVLSVLGVSCLRTSSGGIGTWLSICCVQVCGVKFLICMQRRS